MADEEKNTVEQEKDEAKEDQPLKKEDQPLEKEDQPLEKDEGIEDDHEIDNKAEVDTSPDNKVDVDASPDNKAEVDASPDNKAEVDASPDNKDEVVASPAPGKDDDTKLFIGGLSWSTKEPTLREYFAKYGEITSINIKTDQHTGKSRGFAFVVFKESISVEKVVEEKSHTIDGRKVEPSKAKKRHGKIFVGGLKTEISDDDIKTHFTKFGTITEVIIPKDKSKNTRKNFCFVEFEEEQVAKDLVKAGNTTINDIQVEIKRVTPKPDAMGGGDRGGRGGRGGGRGGYAGGYGIGYGGYAGYGYDAYGLSGYGYGGGYGDYGYGAYGGGGYGGGRGGRGYRHTPY